MRFFIFTTLYLASAAAFANPATEQTLTQLNGLLADAALVIALCLGVIAGQQR